MIKGTKFESKEMENSRGRFLERIFFVSNMTKNSDRCTENILSVVTCLPLRHFRFSLKVSMCRSIVSKRLRVCKSIRLGCKCVFCLNNALEGGFLLTKVQKWGYKCTIDANNL